MDCSTPGFPIHHQLPELTQTDVHWVGDAIQPSHSLSSSSPLPSIFPSMRVFSNESVLCIRWPKYWSFSFNEYSGLIFFRMDLLDLLAVQGTLKSLLQHQLHQELPVFKVEMRERYETARPLPCLGLCSLFAANLQAIPHSGSERTLLETWVGGGKGWLSSEPASL